MTVLVAAAALVLAACSSDEPAGTGSDATSATTSATTTTSAATTTADPGSDTTVPAGGDAPDLGDTNWNVTLYQLESGSMTNLWPGTEITLAFADDGAFSGNAGCNNYSGAFEVEGGYDEFEEGIRDENDGQAIRFDSLSWTEMACTSPNNVMEQELEYLTALGNVGRWVIARGNLSLRTADGFFLVEAEPIG